MLLTAERRGLFFDEMLVVLRPIIFHNEQAELAMKTGRDERRNRQANAIFEPARMCSFGSLESSASTRALKSRGCRRCTDRVLGDGTGEIQ